MTPSDWTYPPSIAQQTLRPPHARVDTTAPSRATQVAEKPPPLHLRLRASIQCSQRFRVSYPAPTAMPTCDFPARWAPEEAKLCAAGHLCPGRADKVVCPWGAPP